MTAGMDSLVAHIHAALGNYCKPGRKICVALSGGMDSVVLLQALAQLRVQMPFALSALHVNHGLSPHAADWAEFCQQACLALDVPCEISTLPPLQVSGRGLERAAREARYVVFSQVDADVLCMAHHQNDRAETLLLNLFRGAGPHGLAAMPGTRFLNGKCLIRPFIDVPRSDLRAWAETHDFRWIEDESNNNLHFRRNYLRHVVLPAVGQQFPAVVSVLARTAAQMQEQTALLARLAELDAQGCQDENGHLIISKLVLLPMDAVRNVLKHRLNRLGVNIPSARRLEALAEQIVDVRPDAEVLVRFGDIGCYLWRDQIRLDRAAQHQVPGLAELVTGGTAWPDGQLTINYPGKISVQAEIQIGPVGQGHRFHPQGRCRGVLSELLREKGAPPWVRSRLPGLWQDDKLCWVAGIGWASGIEVGNYPEIIWMPSVAEIL